MEILNELLRERNQSSDPLWRIQESKYGGRGLFAVRNITAGEVIFKDFPSVIGPRTVDDLPGCSVCLVGGRPLTACSGGCGLPVCYGRQCDGNAAHLKDCNLLRQLRANGELLEAGQWSALLYRNLTLLRCLHLPDKEKRIIQLLYANKHKNTGKQIQQLKECLLNGLTEEEERWLLHCCAVLDGTTFEVPHREGERWSLRGLYPLTSMMNHCCIPNTRQIYTIGPDSKVTRGTSMLVSATRNIAQDEEITTTYCPLLWSTPVRRHFLLLTKQFVCNCCRCQDPTEFGANLAAVHCPCGDGVLLPSSTADLHSVWTCSSCGGTAEAKKVVLVQDVASRLPPAKRRFLLPPTNYLVVQAKLEAVWQTANLIPNLPDEKLQQNESDIRQLLGLLEQLSLTRSRIAGLLLMELYKTLAELSRRSADKEIVPSKELRGIWTEANRILEGDFVVAKNRST